MASVKDQRALQAEATSQVPATLAATSRIRFLVEHLRAWIKLLEVLTDRGRVVRITRARHKSKARRRAKEIQEVKRARKAVAGTAS